MWYLAVFVPLVRADEAADVAADVWPGEPNGSQQLTVALTDGQGSRWLGGNALASDEEIADLQGLGGIPGVRWYRYAIDADRSLAATNVDTRDVGRPWGWSQSCAAAGLRAVE